MESRQVKLLTRAYFLGWLDFKDNTELSELREQIVLSHLEKEMEIEIARVDTLMHASLLGSARNRQAMDLVFKVREAYLGLTLPYIYKLPKIEKMQEAVASDHNWAAIIAEKQRELDQINGKK